jgi:hypothetical protein
MKLSTLVVNEKEKYIAWGKIQRNQAVVYVSSPAPVVLKQEEEVDY